MAVWYFDPPSFEEGLQPWEEPTRQGRWDHRWSYYFFRIKRGQSVWLDSTHTWITGRFPTTDDSNYALFFYYGGIQAVVDDTNKAGIIAANLDNGQGGVIDSTYFTLAPADTPVTPPPRDDTGNPPPPIYDVIF